MGDFWGLVDLLLAVAAGLDRQKQMLPFSLDWYGPGTASGFKLDGNFVIPLPARLYVRGEIEYTRVSDVSPCRKRSNTFGRNSDGMPAPLS